MCCFPETWLLTLLYLDEEKLKLDEREAFPGILKVDRRHEFVSLIKV